MSYHESVRLFKRMQGIHKAPRSKFDPCWRSPDFFGTHDQGDRMPRFIDIDTDIEEKECRAVSRKYLGNRRGRARLHLPLPFSET